MAVGLLAAAVAPPARAVPSAAPAPAPSLPGAELSGWPAGGTPAPQVRSLVVATDSTARLLPSSPYWAVGPQYSGVVSLLINGNSLCSGSLLPDRRSILTAAHCVTNGSGVLDASSATAYFYNGNNPDAFTFNDPASVAVNVTQYFIRSGYTGAVIDNNDVAVLRLAAAAPVWATSYGLSPLESLTGVNFQLAGYGYRSTAGGSVGANIANAGVLRQGQNIFDYTLGNPLFNGAWNADYASGLSTWLADFDSGLAANDASCLLIQAYAPLSTAFCQTGLGLMEASAAPGDSGAPGLVNGMLAGVTSYGISFGTSFGDIDQSLNSTFGEFTGYVPLYLHRDFITASLFTPVPGPLPLLGGAAMFGWSRRLRRRLRAARLARGGDAPLQDPG